MANLKYQANNVVLRDGKFITNLDVCANNVEVTSNVTATYFIGDGSLLTNLPSGGGGGGGAGGVSIVVDTSNGAVDYTTNTTSKDDGTVVNFLFKENPGQSGDVLANTFTITVSSNNLIVDPDGGYLAVDDTIAIDTTISNLRLVTDGDYWYLLGDNTLPDNYVSNNYIISIYSSNTYNQSVYSSNTYNRDTYSSNTYIADTFVSNNYLSTGQVRMREVQLRSTGLNDQVLVAGNNTLGQYFSIVPELSSGGFTSLSQSGDIGLIFTTDLVGSNNENAGLIIAPWNTSGYGFRMTEQGDFYYSGNSHIFYGQLQAFDYGSGTHTGTAAYTLQVDSSGNIIEGAAGGSGGGGTTVTIDTSGGPVTYNTDETDMSDGAVVNMVFLEDPGDTGVTLANTFTINVSTTGDIQFPNGDFMAANDKIQFLETRANLRLVSNGTIWYVMGDNGNLPDSGFVSNSYATDTFASNSYATDIFTSNSYSQSAFDPIGEAAALAIALG